jgi:hypothetical protein
MDIDATGSGDDCAARMTAEAGAAGDIRHLRRGRDHR